MRKQAINTLLVGLFITAASIWYAAGVPAVPFHPDESTQLWMSSDLDTFLTGPLGLSWNPESAPDVRERYRLIDAPLTRYLIGAGRILRGAPPLAGDWNWSLSYQDNQAAGALPEAGELTASRWPVVLLFPFSLLLIYLAGIQTGGKITAWTALLLLATNALVLLHTRRAMAEGTLLFGTVFATWALLGKSPRFWPAALPLGIALNAKHSAAALLAGGLIRVFSPAVGSRKEIRCRLVNFGAFLVVVFLLSWLLNPVLWKAPVTAIQTAVNLRLDFSQRQIQELQTLGSPLVLGSLPERLAAALAQLFFTPPAAADVGNYRAELAEETRLYLQNPLHSLMRSPAGGGLLLALTLAGLFLCLWKGLADFQRAEGQAPVMLAGLFLAQFAALLETVGVPFQRYYLPLIPFTCLFAGLALQQAWTLIQQSRPGVSRPDNSELSID